MTKPKLIHFSTASLDGRLTLAPETLLLYGEPRWNAICPPGDDPYVRLMKKFQPQVFLEGSGSFVLPGQPEAPLPAVEGDPAGLYTHFLPTAIVNVPGRKWLAVVDSGGRGRWIYKEFPDEGWAGWYLLILVSAVTPPAYLAYLQRENIPYLVAGAGRVDLPLAFDTLADVLGVTTVVSTAGGHLSGALLRCGLLDEIYVELLPAAIGGTHTPSLFHAPDLQPEEQPVRLELLECQALPDGRVSLGYRVRREAA